MNEYEVFVETVNPCGGEAHSQKEIIEVEAASPAAYVQQFGRYPVLDSIDNGDGSTTIITGDGAGSMVKYTFS